MKFTSWLTVVFACLLAVSFPLQSSAQEAGILEEMRGRAYWKRDAHSKEIRLSSQRDKGRLLHAGERIRCDKGGRLLLQLYNRRMRIRCPSDWFPIPHVPPSLTNLARQALEEYGRTGGRDRGMSVIYSPSNRSKVKPATFELRWAIKKLSHAFTVAVKEINPRGQEILRLNVRDGTSGRFASDEARRALAQYRTMRGHGPLLLLILDGEREIDTVSFSLLSVQDEATLEQELAFWDKERKGLWRHLGRASAFIRQRMFIDAAEEYEAALAQAPESIDLLKRTIGAQRRAGNFAREEELVQRLSRP